MPDLALQITDVGVDLVLEAGDLNSSATLLEPVLVSLFSDGRAGAEDELPDGTGDPRGFWGEVQGDEWGSLLWLLEREKLTREVAVRAQSYARKALDWLVRDGIVAEVRVSAKVEKDGREGAGYLALRIELVRGSSSAWETAWQATKDTNWSAAGWRLNILLR